MESTVNEKIYDRQANEVKLQTLYHSSIEQLEVYWQGFGISEEQIAERAEVVLEHIALLLEKLVKEECELYESLKEKVSKYQKELEVLCTELKEEVEEPRMDLPLLQKEKYLRTKLDDLEKEKYNRMKAYTQLIKKESALCTLLDMPKTIPSKTIPSQQMIKELEQNIEMLEDEKVRRYKKYCMAKRELTTIMEETEFTPETSFEREVICYDDEEELIVLSNENLQQLTELVNKFQQRKIEMEKEIEVLRTKLHALWDRLNIDKEERNSFLQRFSECRQSTLSAMKHEIERCEEIKKQNIEEYINNLRAELTDLWEKCYVSEEEQLKFISFYKQDFTEDLLEEHDKEVEKMKKYYEETKEILQKIEKRKRLWELMLKFERKAADPNRFHNRGGNLLQEERERKRILKDLPKLEEDILKAIEEYEENNDQIFLVYGVNFQEYIAKQWDSHMKEKENQKMERQRARGFHMDVTKTPAKRTMIASPASAPSKLARTNLALSTLRAPTSRLRRPPNHYTPTDYARNNRTKNSPRRNCQTPLRRVLVERNRGGTPYPQRHDHDDTTSYSQFAVELDKKEREACRSSVLASGKKVLGSKISHSGTLRKSMSRSSRRSSNYSLRSLSKVNTKSFRNTSRTPTKVTPARAKLGLPFLI